MSNEKQLFDEQLASLRKLSSIYEYLKETACFMDSDALLRSEYVLIVSAFDNYLHNIVRRKIREDFFSGQPLPDDFQLPIQVYQLLQSEGTVTGQQRILDNALQKRLVKDSFQSPRSVEYVSNLLQINHLWRTASLSMGTPANQIRMQLGLIVQRRNQIAHEADIDRSNEMLRSIDVQTINDCRDFLEKIVTCIDAQI